MSAKGIRHIAKVCKISFYFTGEPCSRGHIHMRVTSTGTCVQCRREQEQLRYQANPEKGREHTRKYYRANAEKCKDAQRAIYAATKHITQESNNERSRLWRKENPRKRNALSKAYKEAKAKRVPLWANLDRIKEIYVSASNLGQSVDHIIPLRGKNVSGLHVETNLQIMPLLDNIRKRNRFEEAL